jgi:hypothetical protein
VKTDTREARSCEKEHVVVAALLARAVPHDVSAHVSICEVCAEIAQISHALMQDVAPASDELRPPPDATLVWRRAQALAKQQAIAKATRPIRLARICACVVAFVALPWLASTFLNSMPTFAHHLWTMDRMFSAALTGTILLGAAASLILISLSSWYVLRQE